MTKSDVRLVRIVQNQSSWETNGLQMIKVQPAHQTGQMARRKNVVCSKVFPLYHAMKYSIP
jgi:hypothetical protein